MDQRGVLLRYRTSLQRGASGIGMESVHEEESNEERLSRIAFDSEDDAKEILIKRWRRRGNLASRDARAGIRI